MRGRITTVLSLSGVLVAGSAAAMVNTQVLQSAGSSQGTVNKVTIALDVIPADTTTTLLGEALPPIPVEVLAAVADTQISSQATYEVGAAGLVTLDTAGGLLAIVSTVPNAGWTVVQAQRLDAYKIEVELRAGTTRIFFRAGLLFGVVGTSVESVNLGAVGTDTAATNTAATDTAATNVAVTAPAVTSAASAPAWAATAPGAATSVPAPATTAPVAATSVPAPVTTASVSATTASVTTVEEDDDGSDDDEPVEDD